MRFLINYYSFDFPICVQPFIKTIFNLIIGMWKMFLVICKCHTVKYLVSSKIFRTFIAFITKN